MSKEKKTTGISSQLLALKLISKMVDYELRIDSKENPSEAEKRHVEFLRAMRKAGNPMRRKTTIVDVG